MRLILSPFNSIQDDWVKANTATPPSEKCFCTVKDNCVSNAEGARLDGIKPS